MAVVIVHKDFGIYLGNAIGFGFFSKLDCAGQGYAVVFETPEKARARRDREVAKAMKCSEVRS